MLCFGRVIHSVQVENSYFCVKKNNSLVNNITSWPSNMGRSSKILPKRKPWSDGSENVLLNLKHEQIGSHTHISSRLALTCPRKVKSILCTSTRFVRRSPQKRQKRVITNTNSSVNDTWDISKDDTSVSVEISSTVFICLEHFYALQESALGSLWNKN